MGDTGSEWSMGGFDGQSYFSAPWPAHMWEAVQRAKSSSSLHMEALQVLVAARVFGQTWAGCTITMRLDCLALVVHSWPRCATAGTSTSRSMTT